MSEHAFLWFGHAMAAYSGCLPAKYQRSRLAVCCGQPPKCRRSGHGRTVSGYSARHTTRLSIICARRAGALEIVATDLATHALSQATSAGADRVINVGEQAEALDAFAEDKGYFDVLFECSGAASALTVGITALRPGGTIMQLGLGGDMSLPMMAITAKELILKGSFRFHEEFAMAIELMSEGLIDVGQLVTHTFALDDAEQAFITANDRTIAMKTQISFAQ